MDKVLIVKNISREGPGLLEGLLKEANINFETFSMEHAEAMPDPIAYSALVVLGGPDSANDPTNKMVTEIKQVKAALGAGIPYLGICLGLQVAIKARGGEVVKSPVKEVGFKKSDGTPHRLTLTDEGRKDPLFEGLADAFRVFHLHGEMVNLTNDMQLLAIGPDCRNQIVKLGNLAYGIQSHFELTPEMLKQWANEDPDLMPIGEQQLLLDFSEIQAIYTKTGQTLFRNFLTLAGLLPKA
jgi:GMP synthase (glutamine-hydrolysing)